ncbi:MAG: RnfABCDGE type electron transport complex subunit D [Clostridia bacterium]|nr:RnfABCDGE type electron transport complex subunit D [Clostridia bacterium]
MKTTEETVKISKNKHIGHSLPSLLSVSPAPHLRRLDTVRSIMLDVIIALIPVIVWSIYRFGVRALCIILISCATAVISELLYQLICNKTVRITDLSAAVTGLMLGLMMPSGVSLWVPCVGSVFAIIVVKQFFGGLGNNIVNPAIAGRVFLMLCWPQQMVSYVDKSGDLVSSATPLVELKAKAAPTEDIFNIVIGNVDGAIGEISAIAICAGFIYLLFRKVVSWHIPVSFIGSFVLISIIFPITGEPSATFYQVFSGSLLFCALLCANDCSTTPITGAGKIIFGIGCGLITLIIRYFGAYPDGTAFAILIMNMLVPLIDFWTRPLVFGHRRRG